MLQLFRSTNNLSAKFSRGAVVTIGNYDGVHLGHQTVLARLMAKGKELGLPTLAIIFEPQPEEYFAANKICSRLTNLREKLRLLQQFGVENVLCLGFDKKLSLLSAQDFIMHILVAALNARYLVVGHDFVFGHYGLGDIKLLQQVGLNHGYMVEEIPAFTLDGVRVSSSLIRAALAQGNLTLAKKFLGRSYSLSGKVVHGDQIGRNIGFPTANIYLSHLILPLTGVFVVRIYGLDKVYYGVANLGERPTIGDKKKLLEVYIFDFNREIYAQRISVELLHKIRNEIKFATFAQLREKIAADVIFAQKFLVEFLSRTAS